MNPLIHAEFDLDGYRFGPGHPVYLSRVDTPGIAWRDQDIVNPVGENVFFGRDYPDPKPWGFDITITGDTPAEAAENYFALANAWAAQRIRDTPGAELALDFNMHGTDRRIYGRPRDLKPDDATDLFVLETIKAKATFQPSSAEMVDGTARVHQMTMTPGPAGGFVFPIEFPWATTQGGTRQGIIRNAGGLTPTRDVQIEVHGPVGKAVVSGPGWEFGLTQPIAYDRAVTLDVRPATTRWDTGASAAGLLTPGTRLADITIPPGDSEITFTGDDQSGTSTVTVTWRPTITTL
ncbi:MULTISPECIES: hypothetical protein [unclassified Brevibacterium]|uniref:hypothetical protein n=1 Tax=unclassified Brevibacterium TaxID=2614124 RepID=UPI001E2E277F|nr:MULTISPECIES: hypothetical protein [unclassified Brevibacterium]MCD1286480.1 hypothetical protein [Brevibacterium sp. CCUG 69071]MDK8434285.1 hypothetical protein [Brevibacterium sp. H-BE7]